MRFQVPQFIEVEDKVFGPFTIAQFIYLAGGFGFFGALWLMLPLWLAIILGGPVAVLGLALAFFKVNDRPLITTIEHALGYFVSHKLYIWDKAKRAPEDIAKEAAERAEDPSRFVPAATANKLKDLAWSLDVHENLYSSVEKRGQ